MLTSNRNPTNENQPEKTCERVATKVKAYMNIRISVCLLLLLQFAFWNCNPTWVSGTVPHHPRYRHTLKSLKGLNKMAATGCCLENCEPPISQASSCLTAIKNIYQYYGDFKASLTWDNPEKCCGSAAPKNGTRVSTRLLKPRCKSVASWHSTRKTLIEKVGQNSLSIKELKRCVRVWSGTRNQSLISRGMWPVECGYIWPIDL